MHAFQTSGQRAHMLAEHTRVKGEINLDPAALESEYLDIRRQGFLRKESQQTFGVKDVAYPLLGPSGQAIAALTCPYLRRIDEYVAPSLDDVTAMLRESASTLSMYLELDGSGMPERDMTAENA
jgi:DNA-binding IclR family transcriptional regulator